MNGEVNESKGQVGEEVAPEGVRVISRVHVEVDELEGVGNDKTEKGHGVHCSHAR